MHVLFCNTVKTFTQRVETCEEIFVKKLRFEFQNVESRELWNYVTRLMSNPTRMEIRLMLSESAGKYFQTDLVCHVWIDDVTAHLERASAELTRSKSEASQFQTKIQRQ